jgi:hypothetical protein
MWPLDHETNAHFERIDERERSTVAQDERDDEQLENEALPALLRNR